MRNKIIGVVLLLLTVNVSVAGEHDETLLKQVLSGKQRSAANRMRDIYRHPAETLKFFDIRPYMTVVEVWPGAGWYTEILAPYLKDEGVFYTAHFSPDSEVPYFKNSVRRFIEKTQKQPDIYGKMKRTVLEPPKYTEIAPPGSADRVLTFRNVHNWMKSGQAETVFKAMYAALRPGGLLGVVEHRAADKTPYDPKALSGYVHESTVIRLAEQAGFRLLDKSDINRNPKDSTQHPKGVWTLPPSLKLKDRNRNTYLAIGESDRMTLKFIKPYQK